MRELGPLGSPYRFNPHYRNDALLDFFVYSPLGHIASQLFNASAVHLVTSNYMVSRGAGVAGPVPWWHQDWQACEKLFPPDRELLRSRLKFLVPLHDDTPGTWLLNRTALESLILRYANESVRAAYRASGLPSMRYLYSFVPREEVRRISLMPGLRLGDAIAYSPCLLHRSPDSAGGRPRGFLTPTYAAGGSPELAPLLAFSCDTGTSTRKGTPPVMIADVPHPDCYPRVEPPIGDVAEGSRGRKLELRLHAGLAGGRLGWYLQSQLSRLKHALKGRSRLASEEAESTAVPASNVVAFGGEVAETCERP